MPLVTHTIFTDTSPASAQTLASTKPAIGLGHWEELSIVAELVGATGGTLDIYLQETWDVDSNGQLLASPTWYDVLHFTQLTAGNAAVKYRTSIQRDSTIQTIGKNTSPALAAGKVCGSPWGPMLRVLYVAGAGTSAGAAVTIVFAMRQVSGEE